MDTKLVTEVPSCLIDASHRVLAKSNSDLKWFRAKSNHERPDNQIASLIRISCLVTRMYDCGRGVVCRFMESLEAQHV